MWLLHLLVELGSLLPVLIPTTPPQRRNRNCLRCQRRKIPFLVNSRLGVRWTTAQAWDRHQGWPTHSTRESHECPGSKYSNDARVLAMRPTNRTPAIESVIQETRTVLTPGVVSIECEDVSLFISISAISDEYFDTDKYATVGKTPQCQFRRHEWK